MINIVVATHGDLSESLLHCAYMIAGGSGLPGIYSLCMREGKGVDEYLADAQAIIDKAPSKDFILLVDLMSASPCNFTLSAFRNCNYRMITGVNLAMLIEIIDNRDDMTLDELWEYGRSITICSGCFKQSDFFISSRNPKYFCSSIRNLQRAVNRQILTRFTLYGSSAEQILCI